MEHVLVQVEQDEELEGCDEVAKNQEGNPPFSVILGVAHPWQEEEENSKGEEEYHKQGNHHVEELASLVKGGVQVEREELHKGSN